MYCPCTVLIEALLFIFVKFLQKVLGSVSTIFLFISVVVSPIRLLDVKVFLCLAWQGCEVVKDKVSDF